MDLKKFSIFAKKKGTTISSVNIHWKGRMHQRDGFVLKGNIFDVQIPFENKNSGESTIPGLRMQKRGNEVIKGLEVSEPFRIVDVTPKMPLIVPPGGRVVINMRLEGPQFAYDGPLGIKLVPEAQDNIKLEITKQVLTLHGLQTEIPNTAEVMALERGTIFKKDLQMLKAVSFGTLVESITLNNPFRLVSSDPQLPFRIDDGNSYIVAFYIQAPNFNYAGPLEFVVG